MLELPESEQVKAVLMHPDGQRFVTGSSHGVLAVRSLDSGDVLRVLADGGQWVTSLALSPDGTTVAAGRNHGSLETWNIDTGEPGFKLDRAHDARVSSLVFSRDGVRAALVGLGCRGEEVGSGRPSARRAAD